MRGLGSNDERLEFILVDGVHPDYGAVNRFNALALILFFLSLKKLLPQIFC